MIGKPNNIYIYTCVCGSIFIYITIYIVSNYHRRMVLILAIMFDEITFYSIQL